MTEHPVASSPEVPDLPALAADAFIYGFPLVFDLEQVVRFTRHGLGSVPAAPFNALSHASTLAGPEDTFVSINNDTVYSIAHVDVSGGPVRFEVPDTSGRYYVMQFVDAWTNNFAYIGHRATGTGTGSFLLVAPAWAGPAGEGATEIRVPTAVASIIGRWAVAGEADLPAVLSLQQGMSIIPTATGAGLPEPVAGVSEDLAFFEQLRRWMQAFPAAERDRRYERRFEPLGLLAARSPYVDPAPDLAAALREGLATGQARLESALRQSDMPRQNGWDVAYHTFDYNLDCFELGALDDPRWKLPDDPQRYLRRAAAARGGLWGNHGYEAAYAMVYVDGEGRPLHGEHRYELRFAAPPPCRAFWSVTMYDATDFFLVANPIDRYSIGDRTPGLRHGADGSLTIVMQHEEPSEPERRANWLPTPAGGFRPILRMYEPDDALFDGSFELPAITRAE